MAEENQAGYTTGNKKCPKCGAPLGNNIICPVCVRKEREEEQSKANPMPPVNILIPPPNGYAQNGWGNQPNGYAPSGWGNQPNGYPQNGWGNQPNGYPQNGWGNQPNGYPQNGWGNQPNGYPQNGWGNQPNGYPQNGWGNQPGGYPQNGWGGYNPPQRNGKERAMSICRCNNCNKTFYSSQSKDGACPYCGSRNVMLDEL